MKKNFPFFKSSVKGKRKNYSEIIEKRMKLADRKLLSDFLFACKINSTGIKRAENRKRVMLQFYDFIEKDLKKIEDKDFLHFAEAISRSERTPHGKNDVREVVKRFGHWLEEQTEKKFKSLKLIKFEPLNGSGKITSPNDLITELEFDKLIRATTNLMHKTLICLLWESAGRPEEILKMRWSDIDFSKGNIKLHSSKTGRIRIIPVKLTINHLKRLKEESNVNDDDLIFTSQKQGRPLGNASFNFILKNLCKKAGIKKYVSGYTFRHTRLTSLIKTLSPKAYEMFAGHSLQMGMKTYAHLSVDDLSKEMKEKVFGIKKLTEDEKNKIEILEKRLKELEQDNKDIKTGYKNLNKVLSVPGVKVKHLKKGETITDIMKSESKKSKAPVVYMSKFKIDDLEKNLVKRIGKKEAREIMERYSPVGK